LKILNFQKNILNSFPGPKYGIQGIRKIMKIKDRPLVGTIVKPKVGLQPGEHAQVAYDSWIGGCDIVKDDENLTSQKFNNFKTRFLKTIKLMKKAEKETGEKVSWINVKHGKTVGFQPTAKCSVKIKIKE